MHVQVMHMLWAFYTVTGLCMEAIQGFMQSPTVQATSRTLLKHAMTLNLKHKQDLLMWQHHIWLEME